MSEEIDLNKLAREARARAEKANAQPKESREELLKKADELDARKKAFASLDPMAQQAEAQNAGHDTVAEYVKENGLDPTDPNLYRMRAQLKAE